VLVTVKHAQNALRAVPLVVGVLRIMMQVLVVLVTRVVLLVLPMTMAMASWATSMWRREHVTHVSTLVVGVAVAVHGERMHVAAGVVETRQVEIQRHWRLAQERLSHVNSPADILQPALHVANGVHIIHRNLFRARDGVAVIQVLYGARYDVNVCVLAMLIQMVRVMALVLMTLVLMTLVAMALVLPGRTCSVTMHDDIDVTVFQLVHVLPQLIHVSLHHFGRSRRNGHQDEELPHFTAREKTASSK